MSSFVKYLKGYQKQQSKGNHYNQDSDLQSYFKSVKGFYAGKEVTRVDLSNPDIPSKRLEELVYKCIAHDEKLQGFLKNKELQFIKYPLGTETTGNKLNTTSQLMKQMKPKLITDSHGNMWERQG